MSNELAKVVNVYESSAQVKLFGGSDETAMVPDLRGRGRELKEGCLICALVVKTKKGPEVRDWKVISHRQEYDRWHNISSDGIEDYL